MSHSFFFRRSSDLTCSFFSPIREHRSFRFEFVSFCRYFLDLKMSQTTLFDEGPEIEFPTEILSSQFHPTQPDLFIAGAISGHLHW